MLDVAEGRRPERSHTGERGCEAEALGQPASGAEQRLDVRRPFVGRLSSGSSDS